MLKDVEFLLFDVDARGCGDIHVREGWYKYITTKSANIMKPIIRKSLTAISIFDPFEDAAQVATCAAERSISTTVHVNYCVPGTTVLSGFFFVKLVGWWKYAV